MREIIIKYKGDLCPLNQKDVLALLPRKGFHISKLHLIKTFKQLYSLIQPYRYNSKRYKDSMEAIQWIAKAQVMKQGGPFTKEDGPLYAEIFTFYPRWHDNDAFEKELFDSLTQIACEDDRFIKAHYNEKNKRKETGFVIRLSQYPKDKLQNVF